jgi:hypothetical protein
MGPCFCTMSTQISRDTVPRPWSHGESWNFASCDLHPCLHLSLFFDQLPARPRSSKQEQRRDKKMAIHMFDYVPMQALLYPVFVSGIIYPLVLSLVHK